MVTVKLLWFVALFLIFLTIVSGVNRAYAISTLDEEFDSTPSSQLWASEKNNGDIESIDGSLKLSAPPGSSYPYLYLENGPDYLSGDFVFETRFKFYGFQNYGYGIVLADKLLLNGIPSPLGLSDFVFALWPLGESTHSFSLTTILCSSSSTTCNDYSLATTASWDSWHILKIIRSGQVYFAYLDGDFIFESKPTTKIISQLWLGNPQHTGGIIWGNLLVDYIKINVSTPTPTLTPVIVIPGHEASWNYPELLGLPGNNEWKIPEFVTPYDNLINSLKNAGYHEGENLFVFGYDWRKGIDGLADDLKNYINGLGLSGKFDLIGHSYGGLVARGYAQKWGTDKIDKILAVGSPNLGIVNAYGAWEGGEVWDRLWWEQAIMDLLIEVKRNPFELTVEALRRLAPSVKDLLPVFDYLQNTDGSIKPENSLAQRNTFLATLNSSADLFNPLMRVLRGTGFDTKQKITVGNRNNIDELSHRWEDGKPVDESPFVMGNGDGMVLAASAQGPFSLVKETTQDHGGIISSQTGIENIFDDLGLDKNKIISSTPEDRRERVLVVLLHSPGVLSVCNTSNLCNQNLGIYLSGQKLFMWPDYGNDNLQVSVAANGETGTYHLLVGKINQGKVEWRELTADLSNPSETDSYNLTTLFDSTPPEITPNISPESNASGWNSSDVTMSWDVSDPESEISSKTGCGTTTVDAETDGTPITCSATSSGGTSTRTVMVKLDKTKPMIVGTKTPTHNSYGWNNSDVLVGFICSDLGVIQSGIAEDAVIGGTLTAEGAWQSVSNAGNCVDNAGNTADAVTISNINIDKTAPDILINTPVKGANYSLNANVIADWSAVDSLSKTEIVNGTVASGSLIDTSSLGEKSFTVTATDFAGNTNTRTINYNVVGYTIRNFLKPFSDNKVFKNGSTIPVKFQLVDMLGRFVPYVRAQLNVNDRPAVFSGLANTDNYFKYDPLANQYIFNLSTKMFLMMPPNYHLDVILDGVPSYTTEIAMR